MAVAKPWHQSSVAGIALPRFRTALVAHALQCSALAMAGYGTSLDIIRFADETLRSYWGPDLRYFQD